MKSIFIPCESSYWTEHPTFANAFDFLANEKTKRLLVKVFDYEKKSGAFTLAEDWEEQGYYVLVAVYEMPTNVPLPRLIIEEVEAEAVA